MSRSTDAQRDEFWMRRALVLARRGLGSTSPNPMVGAVLVLGGRLLGEGWHHRAGLPHAEIEAFADAARRGHSVAGATLYVTLEPCSTHGRTPPCTDAILKGKVGRVVVASIDPNPRHAGRGLQRLEAAGIRVTSGVLKERAVALNESFNHWIVAGTPWVTVKAAMTLDGKIAASDGTSKWITGEPSRARGMRLRSESDAILVGVNTVVADDPSLTLRGAVAGRRRGPALRRIILDSRARTPLTSKVIADEFASLTTVVVTPRAPRRRREALGRRVRVMEAAATPDGRVDLGWLMRELGREGVTRLLVEGGGEVNGAFLESGCAHRVAFFYAPKILGGARSMKGVAGRGVGSIDEVLRLSEVRWRRIGQDLLLTARVSPPPAMPGG